MHRLFAPCVKAHALLAASNDNRLAGDDPGKLLGSSQDRGIANAAAPRRIAELAPVRRDEGRATIDRIVGRLRIDDDGNARALCGRDHLGDDARRQHALRIVGEHHGTHARHCGKHTGNQLAFEIGADRARPLPVGAQKMRREMLGDEAYLLRRRTRRIDDQ